jgi:hypothetical protein
VATANSQKKSPRNSVKSKPANPEIRQLTDSDDEPYFDRSFDMVARVRAAKEAAQRRIEEFGNVSEYEITTIQGQKTTTAPFDSCGASQSAFEFQTQANKTLLPHEDN